MGLPSKTVTAPKTYSKDKNEVVLKPQKTASSLKFLF